MKIEQVEHVRAETRFIIRSKGEHELELVYIPQFLMARCLYIRKCQHGSYFIVFWLLLQSYFIVV